MRIQIDLISTYKKQVPVEVIPPEWKQFIDYDNR